MELPRTTRYAKIPETLPRSVRRVAPHLNPLEEYQCPECGSIDANEQCQGLVPLQVHHESRDIHSGRVLSESAAFREASRRAALRRNTTPLSSRQLLRRCSAPTDALSWPYALLEPDWLDSGEPNGTRPLEDWVYGKWSEYEPTLGAMAQTQVLPPAKRCVRCDVGTANVRRRVPPRSKRPVSLATKTLYRCPELYWSKAKEPQLSRNGEGIPWSNNSDKNPQTPAVISPESAPELAAEYDAYSDSIPLSSMLEKRYNRRFSKAAGHSNRGLKEILARYRRVRKGMKVRAITTDDSTTDTEAANAREGPQPKERPHTTAPQIQPDVTSQRGVELRCAGSPSFGQTHSSESNEADRKHAETYKKEEEQLTRETTGEIKEETEASASAKGESKIMKIHSPLLQQKPPPKSQKHCKMTRKPPSAASSSSGGIQSLGVITESHAEDRPNSLTSERKTRSRGGSSTRLGEEEALVDLKLSEPPPASPLSLDQEQFRLHRVPSTAAGKEDKPNPNLEDDSDLEFSGENLFALIDKILANKGLSSVTEPKEFPKQQRVPEDSQNSSKTEDATPEKVIDSETRVASPRESSKQSSPEMEHEESVSSNANEDTLQLDVEKCIDMLLESSNKENNNTNGAVELEKRSTISEPKVDRDDLSDFQIKLVSELTEQLVRAHSAGGRTNVIDDAPHSNEDTSALSSTFSLEENSTLDTTHNLTQDVRGSRSRSVSRESVGTFVHSRREISNVVKRQIKHVRMGVGQLEKLIRIQRMLDENSTSKQSNAEST